MADNQGVFAGGDPLAGGSYSHLLFSDNEMLGLQQNTAGIFAAGDSYSFTGQSQKMLCFGDYHNECELMLAQESEITCGNNNLSATSSANNGKIKKKRSGSEIEAVNQSLATGTGAPAVKRRGGRKNKSENSAGNCHPKVKKGKEKLGERITALQQLVSPFGKTDTASVLHEAVGYIKFLHDQVQVLCSPYLRTPLSSSTQPSHLHGGAMGENMLRNDLRSRGLCLVPVESTMPVANNNGADLWSPAVGVEKNYASEQH